MGGIETRIVDGEETGMRLDRWFKLHYPGLGFGQLQKLLRSGQIRVDGGRAKSDTRIAKGQTVRLPPQVTGLDGDKASARPLTGATIRDRHDRDVLEAMLLHEDKKVFVFNKPAGLAVQGGSGVSRHVDAMLEAMRSQKGEKPRLVHRIDRETSGILVVARTRGAEGPVCQVSHKKGHRIGKRAPGDPVIDWKLHKIIGRGDDDRHRRHADDHSPRESYR